MGGSDRVRVRVLSGSGTFDFVLGALKDRIHTYHMNDNSGLDDDHYPVGKGVVDWNAFFRAYNTHTPGREMILEYKHTSVAEHVASVNQIRTFMEDCK